MKLPINIISAKILLFFSVFWTTSLFSEELSDAESFFSRETPAYPAADSLLGWIDSRNI
ncbi:MAG: hypothetical protein H2072_04265, partial [SAR86 cluster bacterium]|nr:hypothetical protein [SAR86 cluster bacterium]